MGISLDEIHLSHHRSQTQDHTTIKEYATLGEATFYASDPLLGGAGEDSPQKYQKEKKETRSKNKSGTIRTPGTTKQAGATQHGIGDNADPR